jgi:hypothetical protein
VKRIAIEFVSSTERSWASFTVEEVAGRQLKVVAVGRLPICVNPVQTNEWD